MAKLMKYRDVASALGRQRCTMVQAKGSHEKWLCPCGEHLVVVPHHTTVSAGVVADIIKKLACLPKGWLQ